MAPIPALIYPKCTQCNIIFDRRSFFDSHMKNVHGETQYMRNKNVLDSVKKVVFPEPVKNKLLDCSECGILFLTTKEQETHNKQIHRNNVNKIETS